jgi:acyl carrier protein phosphodiesterase
MFGALLGDFVKMDGASQFALPIAREILLHRKIDSYTDQHPIIQHARGLFVAQRRRYAGIALDIFYDHVLIKHWTHYSDLDLDLFITGFYQNLLSRQPLLPENLAEISPRLVEQDWLRSYAEIDGVNTAIHRVSNRLSRNGQLLKDTSIDLEVNYKTLETGFMNFFPELIDYVAQQRQLMLESRVG